MSRNYVNPVTYARAAQDQDVRNEMFMKSLGTAAGYDDIDEAEVNKVMQRNMPTLKFPAVPTDPVRAPKSAVPPPVVPPKAAVSPPIDIYVNCKLTEQEKSNFAAQWLDFMLYEKPDNEPLTAEEKKLYEDLKRCGVFGIPKRRMRLRKNAAKRKTNKTRSQYVKKVKKSKKKTTKRKTNKK